MERLDGRRDCYAPLDVGTLRLRCRRRSGGGIGRDRRSWLEDRAGLAFIEGGRPRGIGLIAGLLTAANEDREHCQDRYRYRGYHRELSYS